MFRYFIDKKEGNCFVVKNNNFHHLKNVVRLQINDFVEICCQQNVYKCQISKIESNHAICKIIKHLRIVKNKIYKTLLIGLIKGERWNYMLQKSVELGVDQIIPVNFARNIVKIDSKKLDNRRSRWQKICECAAQQSKRNTTPLIGEIIQVDQIQNYQSKINFVAWENEKQNKLSTMLFDKFDSISFVIGPEGGITENEIKTLKSFNFQPISLGENILRAETAPLYVLSVLAYLDK